MTINSESTFTPNPDVVYTALDNGEAVLLHMITLDYYTLNASGVQVWEQFQTGASASDAARVLTEQYEVTLPIAEKTTLTFGR